MDEPGLERDGKRKKGRAHVSEGEKIAKKGETESVTKAKSLTCFKK